MNADYTGTYSFAEPSFRLTAPQRLVACCNYSCWCL